MTLDARVDERALRELYLAPFEAIVREGGAWAVMAAYNGVNGHPMTESPLLRDVLQDEWGFDGRRHVGLVRGAARPRRPARGGARPRDARPARAVGRRAGRRRARRARSTRPRSTTRCCGSCGSPRASARSTGDGAARPRRALRRRRGRRASCARAAAAGFVLARNEGGLLPLDRAALRRVAVRRPERRGRPDARRRQRDGLPAVHGLAARRPARRARRRRRRSTTRVGVLASSRTPVAGAAVDPPPDGAARASRSASSRPTASVLGTEERPGCAFNWMGAFGRLPSATSRAVEVRAVLRATDAGTYARRRARAWAATGSTVGGEVAVRRRAAAAGGRRHRRGR